MRKRCTEKLWELGSRRGRLWDRAQWDQLLAPSPNGAVL